MANNIVHSYFTIQTLKNKKKTLRTRKEQIFANADCGTDYKNRKIMIEMLEKLSIEEKNKLENKQEQYEIDSNKNITDNSFGNKKNLIRKI